MGLVMFWFCSVFYTKSRTFFFYVCLSCFPCEEVHKSPPRTGAPTWPKGRFHTTEYHVQYIKWGELSRRGKSEFGKGGVWNWAVSNEQLYCASLCLVFFLLIIIINSSSINYYYCILLCFQLLNFSYLNIRVLLFIILPIPQGEGRERGG